PPFQTASPMETIGQVLNSEPVALRRLNPAIPVDLETICSKCLEKTPAKRYATAQELADELGRVLYGEPILARPIGVVSRAVRWCRRKPLAATVAVLASVVIALLAVGGPTIALRESWHSASLLIQTNKANAQKALAESNEKTAHEQSLLALNTL